jgi:uncharacterized protein
LSYPAEGSLRALPPTAAWRHRDARDGFEAVFFVTGPPATRLLGHTVAVEHGLAWSVRYDIALDLRGRTTGARVWTLSADGERSVSVDVSTTGRWCVNGSARPDLDGCVDVDLESSACTNMIPIRRMGLGVGEEAEAPAVYVRAPNLHVERLEQSYRRVGDENLMRRYDYRAPAFNFASDLLYDQSGLVLEYPGIATRVL